MKAVVMHKQGLPSVLKLEDAVRLVAAGKLHPRVAQVMPLEQAAQAHALVEAGKIIGRVVLRP